MKERPMLFNSEMVNAVLSGNKTQTRRVIKDQPYTIEGNVSVIGGIDTSIDILRDKSKVSNFIMDNCKCPYGKVGDQLYVRETFRCNGWATDLATIFYKASKKKSYTEIHEQFPVEGKKQLKVDGKWIPSIHMPRWASRIQLEITDIRVERLNDISAKDALAEGIERTAAKYCIEPYRNYDHHCMGSGYNKSTPECSFMTLWESISGEGSWDLNPWVWVVEFKVV